MLRPGRERFERFPDLDQHSVGQFWSLAYAGRALWIGTNRHAICRREEDGTLARYQANAPDPAALPDDTIYSLLSGPAGHVWVGT
ncbi:two-component regulator propeller domain-containing protein, partial [Stenotrophomonas sp. GbtcB23]|uniref:two-component regulator propeller domain-containing protein n=1 Tax=Stenotrophomonas sp. GbtcB23 TaxID=2824768 RepID=UPI0020C5D00E